MIYLDNAATTKISEEAKQARAYAEDTAFANSHALHSFGMESERLINDSKRIIAKSLNAHPREIYFTKGATESNNISIASFSGKDNIAITSTIEHSSVYQSFKTYNYKEVRYIRVDQHGFIDLDDLKEKLTDEVNFVSFIYVANELGTIEDIKAISQIIKDFNEDIIIHIDATQALGKISCDVKDLGVDLLSLSAHKFHGPKGVGGLYVAKEVIGKIKPIMVGGNQQVISSGTDNHPAIYAMAKALEAVEASDEFSYVDSLNQYLREAIGANIEDYIINSPDENYSPYILNVAFKDIKSEVLLHMLEEEEIYVSSGSACSHGANNRVLEAIGLDPSYMDGVVRFSFSEDITKEDLDKVVGVLKTSIDEIRKVIK